MRVGSNPLRGQMAEPMPGIVAAVITHLPNLKGYHANRLEIVQTCLTSLREHAGQPLPVYVWDNGSGPELRQWLIDDYKPEYLTLSPNIGKASARSSIVRSFPPETIVCVSDDDMYFYPGWLEPQLKLLQGFPNVGVVSGYPVRTQFRWGNHFTLDWARDNANLWTGRYIPDEWDKDFCTSIERDYEWHKRNTEHDRDYLIEYKGMRAYATAHHCQFIAIAERINFIVQWDGEAVSDEKLFDRAVDDEKLLRLTTVDRLTRHIGNVMEPWAKTKIISNHIDNLPVRTQGVNHVSL